jgi:hypothetical protein
MNHLPLYYTMQLRPAPLRSALYRHGDVYDPREILPLEEYPPELPSNHVIVSFTGCDLPIDELLNWANIILSCESILPLNLRRRLAYWVYMYYTDLVGDNDIIANIWILRHDVALLDEHNADNTFFYFIREE